MTSSGDFWNVERVVKENPLASGEVVKWVYLVAADKATINVVQAPRFNRPHIHQDHDEIVYILEGQGQFRVGDRVEAVESGSLVYIPAGTVHTPIYESYIAALSIYAPYFDPDNPDRVFIEEGPS